MTGIHQQTGLTAAIAVDQTLFGLWAAHEPGVVGSRPEDSRYLIEISQAHGELPPTFEAASEAASMMRAADVAAPRSPLFARRFSNLASDSLRAFRDFALGGNLSLPDISSRDRRQEVRDLIEAEGYRRMRIRPDMSRLPLELVTALHRLEESETALYEALRAEEILERIHEILYRSRPLDLLTPGDPIRARVEAFMAEVIQTAARICPEEWTGSGTGKINIITGALTYGRLEKTFRAAWMLLKAKAGLPLFGPPAPRERAFIYDFVISGLKENVRSFQEALLRLRDHFDRGSPEVLQALARSDFETRAYAVEAYFGAFPFRTVPDLESAFRLVQAVGENGFYREIGLSTFSEGSSYGVLLSLGDIEGVAPEENGDIFVLHTHPWIGYLSEEDVIRFSIEPDRFLFSKPDMEKAKDSARRLHLAARAGEASFAPVSFDAAARVHREWLQAFEGAARLEISVDDGGLTDGIRIFYGLHPERNATDEADLLSRLEWYAHIYEQVSGSFQYIRRDYQDLLAGFPFRR